MTPGEESFPGEIVSFGELGRRYVDHLQRKVAAHAAGTPLGVYTGIRAIDGHTRGIQPTELLVAAGDAGAGKSALWWKAALNFAKRQAEFPAERQVGTLVVSLEMGSAPSSERLAQMLTQVPGARLREGTANQDDIRRIAEEWGGHKELPLYFNHVPGLRSTGVRKLIEAATDRHNVGFVVLDHFRMFRMDQAPRNAIDHDEEKAAFLKELALDLNLALVVLAHTRKLEDRKARPTLDDLRGSGQIGAHADFVSFLHRPILHANDKEIDTGKVKETDAEMIWAKNRHGRPGTSDFFFDPATMTIW